jgi:hypothetical protein
MVLPPVGESTAELPVSQLISGLRQGRVAARVPQQKLASTT